MLRPTVIRAKVDKVVQDPRELYRFVGRRWEILTTDIKEAFLWDHYYRNLPEPKAKTSIAHEPERQKAIVEDLKQHGFDTVDFTINVDGYHQYLRQANYARWPGYLGGGTTRYFTEKSLEHYVAATLLELNSDDVYIDIANAGAPTPEIYSELFGCKVYRQDLLFPEGVHGNVIGGDAGAMPIPDGFVSKMALHCSFEHFEQDADMRFIRESARVLRPGGKLCILPLYLNNEYAIQTDPVVVAAGSLIPDDGAKLYCAKGYRNRHGRLYDIPHFISRVRDNLNGLKLTIHIIQNEREVSPACYVKFAAIFEKI